MVLGCLLAVVLQCVVRCSLFVVCCSLFDVCCLRGVRCELSVVCCCFFCYVLSVVCYVCCVLLCV